MALAGNLVAVQARIAAAAARAGRDLSEITLVAVSKTHPPETIAEAYAAGLRHFGENRVQEGAQKVGALRARLPQARWHLIGHLQRNKARDAAEYFDVIHSLDSLRLAEALETRCAVAGKVLSVLVEVNIGGETGKSGYAADGSDAWFQECERMRALPHLRLEGLMAMAPYAVDPEQARPCFARLRALRDALAARTGAALPHLSMGMSGDFEVAIEEGATVVRVGSAIFGPRPTSPNARR